MDFFPLPFMGGMAVSFFFLIPLIGLAFSLWALVDIAKSEMEEGTKIVWALIVLFFNLIGVLVYYLVTKEE